MYFLYTWPSNPHKGGLVLVFKKILFLFENVPPFRGAGGQKAEDSRDRGTKTKENYKDRGA
jgi:hypothetical protein